MIGCVSLSFIFLFRSRSHTNLGPKEEVKASGVERLQATSSRRGSDVQQGGEAGLRAKPNQTSSRSSSRRGSYTQAQGGDGLQAKPNQCSSRRGSSDARRGSDARFAEEDKRSCKGSAKDLAVTDHHIV